MLRLGQIKVGQFRLEQVMLGQVRACTFTSTRQITYFMYNLIYPKVIRIMLWGGGGNQSATNRHLKSILLMPFSDPPLFLSNTSLPRPCPRSLWGYLLNFRCVQLYSDPAGLCPFEPFLLSLLVGIVGEGNEKRDVTIALRTDITVNAPPCDCHHVISRLVLISSATLV